MNTTELIVTEAPQPSVVEANVTSAGLRTAPVLSLAVFLSLLMAFMPHVVRAEDGADSTYLSSESDKVLAAINARRLEAGLVPLQPNPLLNQAAQAHADDIYYNGNYSHYGTDGTLAVDRVTRTGYSDNPWVSENWVSSRDAERAMSWWMNDYIHRVNILTPRWREVGVGVSGPQGNGRKAYVTVFSAGQGATGLDEPVVTASAADAPVRQAATIMAVPDQHIVQPGETLLAIGLRYGLDYVNIAQVNGLDSEALLQIGQTLFMPGSDSSTLGGIGGPEDVPAVETEAYAVQAGETLFSIAVDHAITWQELAGLNGLAENSLLQIGQEIQVPIADAGPGGLTETPATEMELSVDAIGGDPALGAPVTTSSEGDSPQYHVVVPGDTVIAISVRYGIDWDTLLELNGLSEDTLLQPGELLRLN